MKFAQYLNDNLVPEWKSQYLDYKAGKKKLKKLFKNTGELESLQTTLRYDPQRSKSVSSPAVPPSAAIPTPETANDPGSTLILPPPALTTPSGAPRPSRRRSDPPAVQPAVSSSVPPSVPPSAPPAFPVNSTAQESSELVETNDATPLLQSSMQTYMGASSSTPVHPSLLQKHSIISNVPEGSPLRRVMSFKSSFRKVRSNLPPGSGQPDPDFYRRVLTARQEEFMAWVDSQFDKIERFYKQKEDEAIERFLVFQDQLYQLREHKLLVKRSQSATGTFHLPAAAPQRLFSGRFELPSLPKVLTGRGNAETHFEYSVELKSKNDVEQGKTNGSMATPELQERQERPGQSSNLGSASRVDSVTSEQPHTGFPAVGPRRDYEPRNFPVPYSVARRQLKQALVEYYRALELLKNYRMLNRTAFRKMVKKFDKIAHAKCLPGYMEKVNSSYFGTSSILDDLFTKVEDLYAIYFENGNRKIAVEKLRSKDRPDEFYTATFAGGLLLGVALPLLVQSIVAGVERATSGHDSWGVKYLLQIWGGFFLVSLMTVLFTVNAAVFTRFKINYRFIFEFDQRSQLDFRQYFALSAVFLALLAIFGWLSVSNPWPGSFPGRMFPAVYLGVALAVFLMPFDVLYLKSRRWVLYALWRLLFSGLYPVEFRDFFLGDILCSLTYSLSNLSFFFCLYATHWAGALDNQDTTKCGSSHSRAMGFLACLPSIWRLLQCLRRYADSGEWFPHLANTVKYGFTVVATMLLSVWRIDNTAGHKALFVVFSTVNSTYCSLWDVLMDWSLLQPDAQNFLLRDQIAFKARWPYYTAVVFDVLLRFSWVLYAALPREIQQSAYLSFCIAVFEVFRRLVWLLFRMENEHCTNILLSRAARDLPLPYPVTRRQFSISGETEAVGDTGETGNLGESRNRAGSMETEHAAIKPFTDVSGAAGGPQGGARGRRTSFLVPAAEDVGSVLSEPSYMSEGGAEEPMPVLHMLRRAMTHAHAKDFQRRKPKEPETHQSADSSDEERSEDEDEDDDDLSLQRG